MKHLIFCFFLLPLLASCQIKQPEYYDAGYFHAVPPRAEVYGFDERPHDYRHHRTPKKVNGSPKGTQIQEAPQISAH